MPMDKELEKKLSEAAQTTPDPPGAMRALERFFESLADSHDAYIPHLPRIASLFSHSRFLANFSSAHPEYLLWALGAVENHVTREYVSGLASMELGPDMDSIAQDAFITKLRLFRKRVMMLITLRNIEGLSDAMAAAEELSDLADETASLSLDYAILRMHSRHGSPPGRPLISVIGLGKLGSRELNYSSDIDLMLVYADTPHETETTGSVGLTGVLSNRVSAHEFYCNVTNLFSKLLSTETADGFAYRVDLRLRPQGSRGEAAWPLSSYREYYETWGRTWERMVLIRARPVAGDPELGRAFMRMIEPFVWQRPKDTAELQSIRDMKKKVDSIVTRDDIKRGYGGIREAEFFLQTFQLLYGVDFEAMRSSRIADIVRALEAMRFVPAHELASLWDNYVHLRRIEHFLQMADDLQTYHLPSTAEEMDVLGRKMGFADGAAFISDFRVRRMRVKNMYNSLLGTEEDVNAEALGLLEGDLTDAELSAFLSFRGVKDTEAGVRSLKSLRESTSTMLSPDIRALVRQTVPKLLEMGLSSEHPGRALAGLEGFFVNHGLKAAYLRAIRDQAELAKGIVKISAMSPVLSRILLTSPDCLNWLIEDMPIRKSRRKVMEESARLLSPGKQIHDQLGKYKGVEWLRLGLFFLIDILPVWEVHRGLTHLAEAVVEAALNESGASSMKSGSRFAVIAMGRFGGREITYGSDLDLLFVAESSDDVVYAERIIKTLGQYSDRGVLYDVDMRLRPDGTKGVLIKSVEGYRGYYMNSAQSWEVQALLRARPVAGNTGVAAEFLAMATDVIRGRGPKIERSEITAMRTRIVNELAKESQGLDIKLGPGGLEDIEFYIQSLQLQAAGSGATLSGSVIIQNTPAAMRRMMNSGALDKRKGRRLLEAHAYLGKLMSFLRLNADEVLVPGSETAEIIARHMRLHGPDALAAEVSRIREEVRGLIA